MIKKIYGNELRLFPVHAVYNDKLISIVDVYALKFELERMAQENIQKWELDKYRNLDNEDNPVLILYTTKL